MLYIDITRPYNKQRSGKIVTGIDRVDLAYIEHYTQVACAVIRLSNYWLFFSKKDSIDIFEHLCANKPIVLPPRFLWWQYRKPLDGYNFLLNTSHSGLEKPEFLQQMLKYNLRGIYFLHDLIPIEYPEYCRKGSYEQHQQRLFAMSQAALVICNSHDVYIKFINYCQKNSLRQPKVIWAHLGVDHLSIEQIPQSMLSDKIKNKSFFLMVGTIEGRKNHWLILNVWRSLIDSLGENCPKLIIVGKRGWECEQVFALLDRSIQLHDYVIELDRCTDQQMLYLFKHTQALLFPSNAEGFGLPLVEALLMKVPVLASDISIFREIGFGVVELLSPIDGIAWKDKILQYMSFNSDKRHEQIQKMMDKKIQDKLPTWETHFDVVTPSIREFIRV